MPNIKLSYLYRDAGNYKKFGSVVFSNQQPIQLQKIEDAIKASLIEGKYFIASKWRLPDLYFKESEWKEELDHDWREYESIEETEDVSTDGRDIGEFLQHILNGKSSTHISTTV